MFLASVFRSSLLGGNPDITKKVVVSFCSYYP